jgi:hypothetical protein
MEAVRIDGRHRSPREADAQVTEQADPHGCCLRSLRRPCARRLRDLNRKGLNSLLEPRHSILHDAFARLFLLLALVTF